MIRFVSVTKQYNDEIKALDNVSFEIQEGEFVFIVGPSGSGKTTAMKLLIRDDSPSDGKIFFEDLDVSALKQRHVYDLRRKIGVVFQDFKLIDDKNAYENVAFALEASGKSDRDIKETVPYVLEIVGLAHRMDAFPRELSGGEKQKVAIARALANNPKVLLADEPTGNLDPASTWDIVQILSKINNWGTTVIMSTHGSDIVNSLDKRVIRMERGQIVRDDLKGRYDPVEDFETKILVDTHANKHEENEKKNLEEEKSKEIEQKEEKKDSEKKADKKKKDNKKTETKKEKKKVNIDITSEKPSEEELKTPEIVETVSLDKEEQPNEIDKLGLSADLVQKLNENGYNTIDLIVDAGPEALLKIKGMTKEDLDKIIESLKLFEQNLNNQTEENGK